MQRIIAIQIVTTVITQFIGHHNRLAKIKMSTDVLDAIKRVFDKKIQQDLHDAVEALACVHDAKVSWPGPKFIVTDPLGKEVLLTDFKDVLAMEYGYKSYVAMLAAEGDKAKAAESKN